MTRGGYITIIMLLVVMFGYQSYNNNRMLDRYDDIIKNASELNFKAENNDTLQSEVSNIKDSLKEVTEALKMASVKKDTIIKNIKNIYIVPNQTETSQNDINVPLLKSDLLTKSD
jgi:seryl-tRNA synthetase